MTAISNIDTDIGKLLDRHRPEGARWVVWVEDAGFRSCYGPFDGYDEAQTWMATHQLAQTSTGYGVEILPLYTAT